MGISIRKKRPHKECLEGNQPREKLREFMWNAEEEMLNDFPEKVQDPILYSLAALHAMMKPRLELIIALLLDIRDKETP